ncbi:hypothetical protein NKI48_29585 [Mesorhizobium sp. M0644]|uniref:hypothetical protein n=1 Tax=Mesorhizobium sp. M0644 TaxID=2956979 RepID=UPI00333D2D8B
MPIQMVNTYARLWQLETWLRTMVYVELRALFGDAWAQGLNPNSNSFQADKSLTHMPTPEMNALSYAQFSKLIALIDLHWDCFAGYFPPRSLWSSKLEEISQIRHRAAHFRVGHTDDLARVKQFLRDIDMGFWRFCTSYNDSNPILPQSSDPVSSHFLPLDPLPWVELEPRKWAQIGMRDKSLPVGLTVRVQRRTWATAPFQQGTPGYLYDFYLFAQDGRGLDMTHLLDHTQPRHRQIVHLCLDSDRASIRLTVPAVLGAPTVINLVQAFYDAACNAVRGGGRGLDRDAMDSLAHAWPEYVLGPSNPLTFLAPEMPCSFFGV